MSCSVRSLLLKLSIFLAFTGLLMAFSGGPLPGHTGGFGEPTCIRCHTGNPLNAEGGSLAIEGVPASYRPNTDYAITVRLSHGPPAMRWGFQLAARLQGNGSQAGTLFDGEGTRIQSQNNIQYISHNSDGTRRGQPNSASWTITWRSPGPGGGTVQFNAAGNAANNDGTPAGDFIYTQQATAMEETGPTPCAQPNSTYFPQFANGGGVISKLILTNPGAGPVDVCLDIRDDNGNPLSINMISQPAGINPAGVFTIPATGQVILTTDGQGGLVAGSARVGSSAAIGGVVLFTIPPLTTGVGSSIPMSNFVIPVERNAGLDTGMAMVNPGDNPVSINLSLRRLDGSEAAVGVVNLPGRGHSAAYIDQVFGDGPTTNFIGTVVAQVTGGNAAAMAVRTGTEFTTLPVTQRP